MTEIEKLISIVNQRGECLGIRCKNCPLCSKNANGCFIEDDSELLGKAINLLKELGVTTNMQFYRKCWVGCASSIKEDGWLERWYVIGSCQECVSDKNHNESPIGDLPRTKWDYIRFEDPRV